MSVTEAYEPELIETDGTETDFDFAFSVFDDTDVVVAIVDPDTLEVLDTPELGVDYSVTLNTGIRYVVTFEEGTRFTVTIPPGDDPISLEHARGGA